MTYLLLLLKAKCEISTKSSHDLNAKFQTNTHICIAKVSIHFVNYKYNVSIYKYVGGIIKALK